MIILRGIHYTLCHSNFTMHNKNIIHTFIGGSVCVVSLHVALSSSKQCKLNKTQEHTEREYIHQKNDQSSLQDLLFYSSVLAFEDKKLEHHIHHLFQ